MGFFGTKKETPVQEEPVRGLMNDDLFSEKMGGGEDFLTAVGSFSTQLTKEMKTRLEGMHENTESAKEHLRGMLKERMSLREAGVLLRVYYINLEKLIRNETARVRELIRQQDEVLETLKSIAKSKEEQK